MIRSEPGSTGGFGARADLQVGRRTPAATGSADCGEQAGHGGQLGGHLDKAGGGGDGTDRGAGGHGVSSGPLWIH